MTGLACACGLGQLIGRP